MTAAIVGNTGFVGSNLVASYPFEYQFNSQNIRDAYGLKPDLLVYAGMRAEMFLANRDPMADLDTVRTAAENIRKIGAKRVVLISTVAVYDCKKEKDEDSVMELGSLPPYGMNRYILECWVKDNCKDSLVVRLPALFGKNLKKNFIYDFIHYIPRMLKTEKFEELSRKDERIRGAYTIQENGFYVCRELGEKEKREVKEALKLVGFSALNFTDSRSCYQFYNLEHLWGHIETALRHGIGKLNLVTEPISVSEVYRYLTRQEFHNYLPADPFAYDLRTKYDSVFKGGNGYIYNKGFVLNEIKRFVEANT